MFEKEPRKPLRRPPGTIPIRPSLKALIEWEDKELNSFLKTRK